MISKKEIKYRDKTIRKYIFARNWDNNPEFLLNKEVVLNLAIRRPLLKNYKYVYDYEWEVIPGFSDKGKGDLILTDAKNHYLIIECKKKKPQEIRKQVLKYMRFFISKNPDVSVAGLAVSPKNWDYTTLEMIYWDFELCLKEKKYCKLFKDLENPEEVKKRDKLQRLYKEEGFGLQNPISAIEDLKKTGLILDIQTNMNPAPPLTFQYTLTASNKFPKEKYSASAHGNKKSSTKKAAAAKICEQIYLPYTRI